MSDKRLNGKMINAAERYLRAHIPNDIRPENMRPKTEKLYVSKYMWKCGAGGRLCVRGMNGPAEIQCNSIIWKSRTISSSAANTHIRMQMRHWRDTPFHATIVHPFVSSAIDQHHSHGPSEPASALTQAINLNHKIHKSFARAHYYRPLICCKHSVM